MPSIFYTTYVCYETHLPPSGLDCFRMMLILNLVTAKMLRLVQSDMENSKNSEYTVLGSQLLYTRQFSLQN